MSVPSSGPEMVFRRTKMAGKCLTRMRIADLKRETVCSGTSCLNATRNAASSASAPLIDVDLCPH